jgi:DNA-binding NarL/FixJ family response regulator
MTPQQIVWWDALTAGGVVNRLAYEQVPSYKVVADLYAEHTGQGQSQSRDKFLALKRAEQEFYRACAAEHAGRYRASQQTVDAAVLRVIDTEGNTQPRAALLDAGVPAEEAARIAGKTGARRKVKKSLQKHQKHPNAQRMILNEGKREYMRLAADTLSGSLEGIAVNMRTQARLARLESAQAAMAAELLELRAFRVATEQRLEVVEAGLDPRAEAVRLRAKGKTTGEIAQLLGQNRNTVKSWLRRAA